jgi:hypothetical protein
LPGDIYGQPPLKHLLLTTPSSFIARLALSAAIRRNDPYQIGIALHAFADTFAHSNFVGLACEINSANRLLTWMIPKIGHIDFLTLPDQLDAIWFDPRLKNPEVNNKRKVLSCIKSLIKFYTKFTKKLVKPSFIGELSEIIGQACYRGVACD